MKTWKVYEIINSLGTVEYVGETFREVKDRFKNHIKKRPNNLNRDGKFYGRQDVSIHEVARFDNRRDAKLLEEQLQISYGLTTDKSKHLRALEAMHNSYTGDGGKNQRSITFEDAEEIRRLRSESNIKYDQLASQFGVTQATIGKIIRKERYAFP